MISTKLGEVALSRHGHGELHDLAGFVASNGERCAWLSKDTSDDRAEDFHGYRAGIAITAAVASAHTCAAPST